MACAQLRAKCSLRRTVAELRQLLGSAGPLRADAAGSRPLAASRIAGEPWVLRQGLPSFVARPAPGRSSIPEPILRAARAARLRGTHNWRSRTAVSMQTCSLVPLEWPRVTRLRASKSPAAPASPLVTCRTVPLSAGATNIRAVFPGVLATMQPCGYARLLV